MTDILGQSQFVGNKDTEDIFEVALNADGELKLNFETSVGEINLALYDSNGRTVKCDIKDGILTSDMIVAGEYFLRVTAKESSEAEYKITLAQ